MSATPEPRPAWEALKNELDSRLLGITIDLDRTRSELQQAIDDARADEMIRNLAVLDAKLNTIIRRLGEIESKIDEEPG